MTRPECSPKRCLGPAPPLRIAERKISSVTIFRMRAVSRWRAGCHGEETTVPVRHFVRTDPNSPRTPLIIGLGFQTSQIVSDLRLGTLSRKRQCIHVLHGFAGIAH